MFSANPSISPIGIKPLDVAKRRGNEVTWGENGIRQGHERDRTWGSDREIGREGGRGIGGGVGLGGRTCGVGWEVGLGGRIGWVGEGVGRGIGLGGWTRWGGWMRCLVNFSQVSLRFADMSSNVDVVHPTCLSLDKVNFGLGKIMS